MRFRGRVTCFDGMACDARSFLLDVMTDSPEQTIAFIWLTVFLELRSRKTVRFSEQIMSADKYTSIFSQPNWGYCVYYPSVLKIGEYPRIFPSFIWGIFAHVTHLDQSRASENIWWIIIIVSNYYAIIHIYMIQKWVEILINLKEQW